MTMEDYEINVGKVEEWQMINDLSSLNEVFQRAKRVLVGGGTVALIREQRDGSSWKVDEFTDLEGLEKYKERVYKFLTE